MKKITPESRTIVALSGGKASAWCAGWALKNRDNVILYFNDTKWEDKDLYRFLDDLERFFGQKIVHDSDGRSVEEVFQDERFLGNSRIAICSRVLKAQRLQNFIEDGDELVFGIGTEERHRAIRISEVYMKVGNKKFNKPITCTYPLIKENINPIQIDEWLKETGIKQPIMYDEGFKHNNCAGGCVRAGKKHWKLLLEKKPEVYAERERMENEMREELGKDVTILKDITLKKFREDLQANRSFDFPDDDCPVECVGICSSMN